MNKEIHIIQMQVLKGLLLHEGARFTELKPKGISSDQFTFHLKRLIESGIVVKKEDGLYHLTPIGKDYANRFDTDSSIIKTEKQAKITVLVIASQKINGVDVYVMQQRLKHPFFGFRGFVTGKIKLGESVIEAGARELEEETGLRGKIHHKSVYHERIYSSTGDFLEDKYFFICTADNLEGKLQTEFEGGKNEWISKKDILKGNIFYDIADLLALVKKDTPAFSEKSYIVEKY